MLKVSAPPVLVGLAAMLATAAATVHELQPIRDGANTVVSALEPDPERIVSAQYSSTRPRRVTALDVRGLRRAARRGPLTLPVVGGRRAVCHNAKRKLGSWLAQVAHKLARRARDAAGKVDATPASRSRTISSSASSGDSCTAGFGSFAVSDWPSGHWRPYAADSPINKPVPASPRIHPNSAAYVARLLSLGGIGKVIGNVKPKYDWQVPYYFSSPSDPLFTLDFSENWGATSGYGSVGKSIEGKIRIPDAARYAGQGSGQTYPDAHLTVIDQSSGWVYDLYEVQSKPAGGGTIVSRWAGRTRIDGSAFDGGEATAWGGGRLAGVVRAQEWMAGKINHALYVVAKCTTGGYVTPAYHGAARCSDTTNALPTGARLWLDYSEAEIAAAAWPEWKKTLVRAWANYGGYVGDTGGSGFNPVQIESPETYRSFGYADPLVDWAETQHGVVWLGSQPVFDLASGIDWAGRLRVLDWNDPANR
jgi:hypothetical protein